VAAGPIVKDDISLLIFSDLMFIILANDLQIVVH
jgi:hypothetical protein